ncbi:GntR family transcriptional regulator [Alphaproteobacteria bacterium KMM 3653]|uniref:GntR family transcriptional regulator n=1 Tax=Harenicola maris TaxID=2841044 RepID=A0AAP2CPG4_9RHOB|nr:GntR family transcriptional regulator [Harenicola maris]
MSNTPRPSDRVYEMIRTKILDGTFKPGDAMVEATLADMAQTSRTPVREALRRLSADGLVYTGENRRSSVSEFDAEELGATYEIRVRLESLAAGLACQRADEAGIAKLTEINARIEDLGPEVSNYSLAKFLELNAEFHLAIVRMAGSRQLETALTSAITVPIVLLKHYVWGDKVQLALSLQQHREIILALQSGNEQWAASCMASHIQTTRPAAAR